MTAGDHVVLPTIGDWTAKAGGNWTAKAGGNWTAKAGGNWTAKAGGNWTAKAAASTRASVTYFEDVQPGRREIGAAGYAVQLPESGWPELPHDLENAAAAVEIARLLGIDPGCVERAIAGFRPLRHRLAR